MRPFDTFQRQNSTEYLLSDTALRRICPCKCLFTSDHGPGKSSYQLLHAGEYDLGATDLWEKQ
ncbi:unnamed protein product, partial [Larinioides sclopetarius]